MQWVTWQNVAKNEVLQRIASIVDEADVVQDVMVEPAAAGLDLICRGIRLVSGDDTEALQHGALVFSALYAQLGAEAQAGEAA